MAIKTSSRLLLLAAASIARAQDLCPALDDIGHAIEPQSWVLSNLNWTLTQISRGTWPTADWDWDEARVTFSVQSDFNKAPVQCTAQGKEFSEEYLRQLGGHGGEPSYSWYECEGDSEDVKTEFKMAWWNTHTADIRQTWTCPETGKPMRATGELSFKYLVCEFDSDSRRTHCAFRSDYTPSLSATIVQVLPPPTRECAAASTATPDWAVLDFKWVYGNTTYPGVAVLPHANMTFRLTNEALGGYTPRMNCTEPALHGPQGGVYITPYACTVFEANEEDVPVTRFDWVVDGTELLRINQTWFCDDGADRETRYQSIGELDVTSLLSCETVRTNTTTNGYTVTDITTTCIADSDFEIKGELQ